MAAFLIPDSTQRRALAASAGFPLMDAIYDRRSRRFFIGAAHSFPAGDAPCVQDQSVKVVSMARFSVTTMGARGSGKRCSQNHEVM